jgi:segregation and condensation protein B
LLNFPAEIIQVEDSYGLYLKPDEGKAVFEYLDELAKARGLSRAAMETLAVIAFKGPITRKEIMKIRGVSPDSSLATLLEYELIDRFEKDGKTYYRITKKFLRSAGLSSEKELEKLIKEAIEKETDEAS